MHHIFFVDQVKRSKKTVVYFCLLLVAAAFFVSSINLYQNSVRNLQISENVFSTLAVTELYGEVDQYGQLVERNSEEHIGYKAVGVKGYDFSDIIDSEAVESWDLRTQYGAYIEGHPAVYYGPTTHSYDKWYMRSNNIIRFKIRAETPISLKYSPFDLYHRKSRPLHLDVIDNAADCFHYPGILYYQGFGLDQETWTSYSGEIKRFNRTDDADKLILYPDVEYIAVLDRHGYWV